MRSGTSFKALLVALVATSIGLSACQSAAEDPAPKAGDGLKGLKRTQFAFDNYLGVDVAVIEYARQRIYDQCVAKLGYPQNLKVGEGRPFPTTSDFATSPAQFGLVSEAQARDKGFGQDPGWAAPKIASFDANYEKAADSCNTSSWRSLGADAEKIFLDYQNLGNELLPYRAEVDNRLPKDLSRKMLDCIKSKGHSVPDEKQFLQTPQPQVMGIRLGDVVGGTSWTPQPEKKGVQVEPPAPPRRYEPTPAESALAVDWYRCQQDTGWTATQMKVAADVQREFIEKRADRLLELNPKIQTVAKLAAGLVGRG